MQRQSKSLSTDTAIVAQAPAKLNLGLHILRKRADGYHDLDTVFLKIGWVDRLLVARADSFEFTTSDPDLPVDAGNLCVRAARLLSENTETALQASIHLEKNIPYGAGMGGGSSDAATTLDALSRLWDLPADAERLHRLAAQLGSDVPFFLLPERAAHGAGRGEVLIPMPEYSLPFSVAVIVPAVPVSTAQAYALVRPNDENRPDLVRAVASNDLDVWRRYVTNDFQTPIFEAYPAVADAHRFLLESGADYAAMSGSGSAVFALFEDAGRAAETARLAAAEGYRSWAG